MLTRGARHTHILGRRTVLAGLVVDSNCAALQGLWEDSSYVVEVLEPEFVDMIAGTGLVIALLAEETSLIAAVAG